MRLQISKSKNSASLYVIKTIYTNGKEQTKIVEKLGTEEELRIKLNGADPYQWANEYIKELNKNEKEESRKVLIPFAQSKIVRRMSNALLMADISFFNSSITN